MDEEILKISLRSRYFKRQVRRLGLSPVSNEESLQALFGNFGEIKGIFDRHPAREH